MDAKSFKNLPLIEWQKLYRETVYVDIHLEGVYLEASIGSDSQGCKFISQATFTSEPKTALITLEELPDTLYVSGSDFQFDVWRYAAQIPPGQLTTYGELAEAIGRPRSARAVGSALGKNPIVYLIPCHRITASDGLGGFRDGLELKGKLITHEKGIRYPCT